MFIRGSSELNGSWKMICIRRRRLRNSRRSRSARLRPSSSTAPEVGSIKRSTQRPVVVFPHPDSPTRASVSPRRSSKLTPSTARTWPTVRPSNPLVMGKCFTRSVTLSTTSPRVVVEDVDGARFDISASPGWSPTPKSLPTRTRRRRSCGANTGPGGCRRCRSSDGTLVAQGSKAWGHRGANRQPEGMSNKLGTTPSMAPSRWPVPATRPGMEPSRAWV